MRVFIRSAAALAVLLLCGIVLGQGTTGSLVGTVTSEGNGLPGVTVTVSSPALQGLRTAVTGETGGYLLAGCRPATIPSSSSWMVCRR